MLLWARRLILRIRVRGVHAQPPKRLCQVLRRGRGQRRREGREWASRRWELGSDEMGVGCVDHVQRFQYGDRGESLVEQMRSERLSWLAGHDADQVVLALGDGWSRGCDDTVIQNVCSLVRAALV